LTYGPLGARGPDRPRATDLTKLRNRAPQRSRPTLARLD
jgi:hypothetical protein